MERVQSMRRSSSAPALPVPDPWEVEEGQEFRESPEYARWYYSQFPRDSRVPPPVVSHETYCTIMGAKQGFCRVANLSVMDTDCHDDAIEHPHCREEMSAASRLPSQGGAQPSGMASLPALVEDKESSDEDDRGAPAAQLGAGGVPAPPPPPPPQVEKREAGVRPLTKVASGLNSMAAPFIPGSGRYSFGGAPGASPQTPSASSVGSDVGCVAGQYPAAGAQQAAQGYRLPQPAQAVRQGGDGAQHAVLRRAGSMQGSCHDYQSAYSATPTSNANGHSPPATPPVTALQQGVPVPQQMHYKQGLVQQQQPQQVMRIGTPVGTPLTSEQAQSFDMMEGPGTPVTPLSAGSGSFSMCSGGVGLPRGSIRSSPRSKVLEEYCNTCHMRAWEIKDLVGCVADFARDPDGACLLQRKLDGGCSEDDIAFVFNEVQGCALQLMQDPFGNYVMQKLVEHGNEQMRTYLFACIKSNVRTLSLQTYGCRVVQRCLEAMHEGQRADLLKELEPDFVACMQDQNGNHVIQKAVELCGPLRAVAAAVQGQAPEASMHPYGCRCVQRLLQHAQDVTVLQGMLNELVSAILTLATDQFGNHVVQHLVRNRALNMHARAMENLAGHLPQLAMHKYAANVVEMVYSQASPAVRCQIIDELAASPRQDGVPGILSVLIDQYGSFVVQKIFDASDDDQRLRLVSHLKPHTHLLGRAAFAKHFVERLEKMGMVPPTSPPATPPMEPQQTPPTAAQPPPHTRRVPPTTTLPLPQAIQARKARTASQKAAPQDCTLQAQRVLLPQLVHQQRAYGNTISPPS